MAVYSSRDVGGDTRVFSSAGNASGGVLRLFRSVRWSGVSPALPFRVAGTLFGVFPLPKLGYIDAYVRHRFLYQDGE